MPIEIIDVLANIPHSFVVFYYISKACHVRRKCVFISLVMVIVLGTGLLNNFNIIDRNVRVVIVFLVVIFGVVPFAWREKMKAVIFCFLNYIVTEGCEMLTVVIVYSIYAENRIVLLDSVKEMLFLKTILLCITILAEQAMYMLWNKISMKAKVSSNRAIFLVLTEAFLVVLSVVLMIREGRASAGISTILIVLISIALNAIAFYLMEQTDKKNQEELKGKLLELQVENQKERKRELDADIEKVVGLKSYIASRIDEAMGLLRGEEGQEAHRCLENIMDQIKVQYSYSNNKVADAIVSEKAGECADKGIRMDSRLIFPDELMVSNAELCVILSNLLDNSIRACERCTQPYIVITSKVQKGYLVIKQTNSFDGRIDNRKDGAFSEHGLGLEILDNIAQRHEGKLIKEYDDKIFTTTVVVKI